MKRHIFFTLFLILTTESECSPDNGFFISAPGVFHVGVNEKVFVQMGRAHLNNPVTVYLEIEPGGIVSEQKTVVCATEGEIKTVELMIDRDTLSRYSQQRQPYLNLVAVSPTFNGRKQTRVLVSNRRGNIFIQTDQPIYNPTQTVRYRIFTLDHAFRPNEGVFQISVFNAAGNRIMKSLRSARGGIYRGSFPIPDVSKMGIWRMKAHYEGDEEHAAFRDFRIEKFVLPSFEVNVAMKENYILLNAERIDFTISAKYSHGENVKGAYHCQFAVVERVRMPGQKLTPVNIKGLELTGSITDGSAAASLQIANLNTHLLKQKKNQGLLELQQSGAQIYLKVFVTNIQSGEMQQAEVHLPILSHKYKIDLSRTRSHFLPGYPLDVVVRVSLPDGSPAVGVPVIVDVPESTDQSWLHATNQEGAVFPVFNIPTTAQITVQVSVDGLQQSKVIQRASPLGSSYLYLSFNNKIYSVGDLLAVNYNTNSGQNTGFIYYMVLSRGAILRSGSHKMGTSVKDNLLITSDMVPSFRLIGYYYEQDGNIIADSVWVDVRDECAVKVKVEKKGLFQPSQRAELHFNLHGQRARVALLAVDKAMYALHEDNKLTSKQVFSSMQSYDLGCSYSGGPDPASVLRDAGLSFVTQSLAIWRKTLDCDSARQKRSVDLEQEMMALRSNFSDEKLQECCVNGFSLIPMRKTCQERMRRVSLVEANPLCADVFLKCCLKGEHLRQKKMEEDALKGLARTASIADIEEFFMDTAAQYIRRHFPPSFAFEEFDINNEGRHSLSLPDSITTWEIQVATLSAETGFCVIQPSEFRAFKSVFVSLRLPYSVRRYEQLSISPVIYNYGEETLQVAVNMEQTEGLCSPGSATASTFVRITLEPHSSQFVSFSAVPMVSGLIPITIRLYDTENEAGLDAITKTLNVLTEGLESRIEETKVFNLDGRSSKNFTIDGSLPDDTIPGSSSNIFISAEGDGFDSSHARNLLSPEKVANLIELYKGCLEQTMIRLAPTTVAIRYLDLSQQWFDLPAGARDEALDKMEAGFIRILEFKKSDGSYGPWTSAPSSNWVTALVVKVLSLVAERQTVAFGQQGRAARVVPDEEIRRPVRFLLSAQETDGSFNDQYPVLNRDILKGIDREAAMTAFITVALQRSLQFLQPGERNNAKASITRATSYLLSHLEELQHPYAVAITAHCLSFCLPKGTDHSAVWKKLQALATEGENGCYFWTTDPSPERQKRRDAITIQTTAYALLAAVELEQTKWADKIACWITTQENYFGGGQLSTQDTIMALEALAEYELKRSARPEANLIAEFTVTGKRDIVRLTLERRKDKVETDLKKLAGNNIHVRLTGNGDVKLKVAKAFQLLDPKDDCKDVSISVTVEGKVKYTEKVVENYDYYDDYGNNASTEARVARSASDWFDDRTRNRRDLDNMEDSETDTVTFNICVSHSLSRNLSGMAIADITLLSGFEAVTQDLDKLKAEPEQYISHYEVSYGRVVIYFNELFEWVECISFDAVQRIPIGLLQPAPAVFYDYYEPNIKCTVFYSAPKRSKMVSKLCSEDVCQCAERPCHQIQKTFQRRITKSDRSQHACFFPVVDYAYIVEVFNVTMKSNFEMYETNVKELLRSHGDFFVSEDSVRVFAKRRHCKGQLDLGKQYLIMGKDGTTTDSNGRMQYLLESNTWVERKPLPEDCKRSAHRLACRQFNDFTEEYKIDGCRQ